MASFPRVALFFLALLVSPLFLCSSASTLDKEEKQKEEEALQSVGGDLRGGAADEAPQPPQNLVVFPQSDTSIMLTWSPPSDTTDFDHYLVYVEDEDMEDTTDYTYYIFNNLEPCTDYTFGVMSVSAAGDTSDPLLDEGQTEAGTPPAPQNLQVDGYTGTTVTLSWDKPDTLCDIEEYRVRWSTDGIDTQSTTTSETSFTVTELTKNTTYIFSVFARTSFGEGTEGATVQQTTDANVYGPPENLLAVGVSSSAINVSWSPPEDEPNYYVVSSFSCDVMEDRVSGLSYLITGLDPCQTCEIYVTSYYDDTQEYTAAPVRGTTDAGDPPPPESCSVQVEGAGLRVTWVKAVSDCSLGQDRVQWTGTKLWGDGGEESGNVTTAGATHYIDTVPYSQYTFEISSSIDGVFGSPSSCSGTSSETQPGSPGNVAVESEQGGVVVTWETPVEENGDIVNYGIFVDEETTPRETVSGDVYTASLELGPCQTFDLSVKAENGWGWGLPSEAKNVTSEGNDPPPPVSCSVQVDGTGLRVTWVKAVSDCSLGQDRVQWTGTKLWGDGGEESGSVTTAGATYYIDTVPYSQYTFEISSSIDGVFGSPSSCSGTSSETQPGSPGNVAVESEQGGVVVTWETPVEENGVIENYGIFVDEETTPQETVSGDVHTASLELGPCQTFDLSVKAKNGAGWGLPSEVKNVTSEGNGAPPPESCSVQVEEEALIVTWQEPESNCPLGMYSASWTGTKLWGDEEKESGNDTTLETMFTVPDPVPYSLYTFEISASTDGVFGISVSCSGTSQETKPGAPVIVTVDSVQGEAVVTWETPAEENGLIVEYGIYIEGETDPQKNVSGDVHSTSLELEPCKTYGLSVKAKNGKGWGQPSEVKNQTIVDDVLPTKVDCSAGDFNVEVCWDPYSKICPVSRYNLMWEGDVLWSEELVDINSTSLDWSDTRNCHNITALPYTKYDVELTVGNGTQSISCFDTTPMAAPGPPADVRLTTQDLTVHVTWTEPEMKNGILDHYQIIWNTSTGSDYSDSTVDSSTFSYDILELPCGETVNVMVRAIIKAEEGELNGKSSAPQAVHLANSVQTVNCEPFESGQVSLSWTLVDPECPVSSYNVTWVYDSLWSEDTGEGSDDVGEDETSFIVSPLPAYSNVVLQVHVDNIPEYTECITVTSQEKSSPPTALKQTANDSSSVTVTWGLPEYIRGELEGWYLRWTTPNNEEIDEDTVSEVQTMTYTISGLSKSSTYFVYVSAVNGAGNGEEENTDAHTAQGPTVDPQNSSNTGLIIGLSTAGGILLILLLVGSIILFRRRGSSKPPRSSHMPEVADTDSDELYKMQHLSSASQELYYKHGSVDYGTNSELYMGPLPSLHKDKAIIEDVRMPDPPPDRRYSQQVSTSLPRLQLYNRRPSQQVNTKLKNYEEYNRRPSQQDLAGRPPFSGGPGRPSLGEYGRRPSQQVDLGRPNLARYGRRPSQQVDLGKPRLEEYGRRPSQQINIGRPASREYSRRPSQQLPSGGGSYPSRPSQEEAPRRSSVDLYSRRPSQQADIGRPGDRMFMRRPSQQFIPSFAGIQEQ